MFENVRVRGQNGLMVKKPPQKKVVKREKGSKLKENMLGEIFLCGVFVLRFKELTNPPLFSSLFLSSFFFLLSSFSLSFSFL